MTDSIIDLNDIVTKYRRSVFEEGYQSYLDSENVEEPDNPYHPGSIDAEIWMDGWRCAKNEQTND